jgi:DNA replication protein DnaC|tara:strand:- start:303 stop:1070 length:768 start_codon:yes stop_codon:yes gene_type:complete
MESLGDIYKNIKLQKSKNPDNKREIKQQNSLSDCKICNGIGWLGEDVEIFDPEFSKLTPCRCLNSQIQESIKYFSNFSIKNFNPNPSNINLNIKHKKSLAQAYEVAKNYAKNPEGWLTFYGPTGVGKTHLAIAIFMNLKAKGHDAMFVFVPDMLDELRNSYSGDNDENYVPRFNLIKDSRILILDDFGSENYSKWAHEKLYQIITWRYNRKLPTVITSPNDFDKKHDAILSRIQDPLIGQIVKIDSVDYRIKGKK